MKSSLARLRIAIAGIAVVVIVGLATPTALGALTASVWPQRWNWADIGAAKASMLVVLAVAAVAWLLFVIDLCGEIWIQLRSNHPGGTSGSGARVQMVGWVVGLILMVLPASLTLGSIAGAAGPPAEVGLTITPAISPSPQLATAQSRSVSTTYIVQNGDCLSAIASRFYGDEGAWVEIWQANSGRVMTDGRHFNDPNLIHSGWTLTLPDEPTSSATGPPMAAQPSLAASDVLPSIGPLETINAARPVGTHRSRSELPDLIALGIGAIGSAALFRRSRRLRLLRQAELVPRGNRERDDRSVDTEILLARFSKVPALHEFEEANYRLGASLRSGSQFEQGVTIRAICVGSAGVDFWLSKSDLPAPNGFLLEEQGRVWRSDPAFQSTEEETTPYFLVALPVGEDDAGTWLVPLLPGACLPILGEAADALLRAARPVQESWSWSHMVVVTDDPIAAAAEVRLHGGGGPAAQERQVLYLGDTTTLPAGLAPHVSMVTALPVHASDVTVLVDDRGASIHPLGRTMRPHIFDTDTAAAVEELINVGPAFNAVEELPADIELASDVSSLAPGRVDVRLLSVTPRLEGLAEQLPANRSRRAIELVAYLALHQPDSVTSDRLRTRVLGSSDADAASKTLFNTATAARRAMGTNAAGDPLLPPGSRTGHYRVSADVTVDVLRAAEMATIGSSADDPNVAMAYLRASLDLVEGEPLANALSGYSWWEAEGHGARIAAVLVNAACNLAALAVEAGRYELAQWGLGQARLVDPYSEALSRAAMQVAAAGGDADRLRREWRDCQRRVDELDPGATPSPRTERLYGELAQTVLVGAVGSDSS
jgi:DNA-binding SARP family transcriptional activator